MKRRQRLRDGARFRQVRRDGTSHTHPLLVLCSLPNQEGFSRCGFTVSRRIGKAVERNRARRRMSEAVRPLWDLVMPGWDLVWIARPGIVQAEFSQLQSACARLLRRARLLRTPGDTVGALAAPPQEASHQAAPHQDGTSVSDTVRQGNSPNIDPDATSGARR